MTELEFSPPCGPVVGRVDGSVVRATGIPYARAERFEMPRPVADWSTPYRALRPAPASPQPSVPSLEPVIGDPIAGLEQSEDCQNLSITLPADLRPGERLPVMVWIHGGSYVSGAGDSIQYDAASLVSEQRVVFVAVTYRLGLLGYLGGPSRPANLGLLDQIAAFEWVQRNIGAFGGDPDRVTAFGQSAGGDAIAHIMATPDAERLFTRAIIQSAPLGISRGRARMAAAMAEAAATVDARTPIAEVLDAQARVTTAGGGFGLRSAMAFGTKYGFEPLPAEDVVESAWGEVAPRIAVLVGSTAQETRLFIPEVPAVARLASVPAVGPAATSALSWTLTRRVYGADARRFARRHRAAGGAAQRYVISFAAPGNRFGAAHAVEVPLLFGDRATWEGLTLLEGVSWDVMAAAGVALRRLWAGFAHGEMPSRGDGVPGVVAFDA